MWAEGKTADTLDRLIRRKQMIHHITVYFTSTNGISNFPIGKKHICDLPALSLMVLYLSSKF